MKLHSNVKFRLYQEMLLDKAVKTDLLCVLPTGTGKTLIGLGLSLLKIKDGKILFLTPTKPLCEQHKNTFEEFLTNYKEEDLCVYNGSITPKKRIELWEKGKIIFATGETIENDIIIGRIDLNDVSLIIFDEAHRGVGDYAYTFIAKTYLKCKRKEKKFLGLTASPGSDIEKIKEIMRNLNLKEIEIIEETDEMIRTHVKKKKIKPVFISLSEEHKKIKKFLENSLKNQLLLLKNCSLIESIDQRKINKRTLLLAQKKALELIKEGENLYSELSTISACIKILHSKNVFLTQGAESLLEYYKNLLKNKKTKANKTIVEDIDYKNAISLVNNKKIKNPKIEALIKILKGNLRKTSKAIIFTNYRKTTEVLKKELIKNKFGAEIFIGQRNGMSQKEQKKVLEKFKKNEFQILVCTSIGEEGIHIPSIDIGIFYEPIPSALRNIQRRGRVGRTNIGKIFVLIMKNTIDEAYYWVSKYKERNMRRAINELKEKNDNKQKLLKEFFN